MSTTTSDAAFARDLADQAGRVLLQVRTQGLTDRALKDAGDAAAQQVLAAALAQHRPHDAVLSEEARDSPARLSADRVWIIDPLDGTREFSEPGRQDWAVHVALWQHGDLVAGAVALPAQDVTFATDVPPVPPQRPDGPIRIAVSRTRPPQFVVHLAEELGAELVPMGSAGAKCAAVWQGTVDAYVHAGGQYEWDSAAPVAVALAAGLHATRLDGSRLTYNHRDPLLPDLLICRAELAETLAEAVHRHRSRSVAP